MCSTYLSIVLRLSMTFYSYSVEHSTLFSNILLLTQQISLRVYKTMHMYCTYSSLLICTIHALYLSYLESLAPRPNQPLSLIPFVTPELAKLLITSTSLCPTLKGSLLIYLNHLWYLHNIKMAQYTCCIFLVLSHLLQALSHQSSPSSWLPL